MSQNEERDNQLPLERELCERVRWFVRLRWLAGMVVVVLGATLRWVLGWKVSPGIEMVGLGVLLYNVAFWRLAYRLGTDPPRQVVWTRLANLQISLDLVFLTILYHFTGGLFSPFLPYAVFHVMIASLLLRRRDVCLQAGLAIVLVALLGWAEWRGWSAPETLGGHLPNVAEVSLAGVLLPFLGFLGLLGSTAYLASTIRYALQKREMQLLEAQRHLRQTYQQLEEVDRSKTEFTRMVTHELRAPVAALQSMLEVLRRGYAGELPQQAEQLAERAARRTETLLELVNQLLDLARDKAHFAPQRDQQVRVMDLFQEMEETYRSDAETKGVRFVVDLDPPSAVVVGDPDELTKLLSNLVSNAVKYTPEGGEVTLRGRLGENEMVLQVSDTGIGISKTDQERLFTEFFRASNARKVAEHGTGLGLTIVRRIVEAHQGRLEVSSEENKGTTFTVYLPVPDRTDQ